ncbi:TIGR03067 domain-containing protein [Roseiconus nitratireducens]|uniref:TIGR03067 domain-containing protein n=1 Tax=Roseiconus nitratireducens TaxID=2605748 RepID=A0A5M6CTT9_9BACT|nr:TIGR03067 domain-containing protein [Roseiconus nitratireducens]KAA5538631.1 TIGR03067 domain-containing protein [Roseiconus nitratireducens]
MNEVVSRSRLPRDPNRSPTEIVMATRSFALFLAAAMLATVAPVLVANEPRSDAMVLRKLQGHWKAEKWVIHGKETSEGRDNRSYRIDRRKIVFITDGKDVGTATFKIDVSDKPFEIDVTYIGGPRDGQTLPGIFRLEEGKFFNCFPFPGDPRPTSFESTATNRCFLSVDRKKTD